ncbi:MAG: hypothetical protein VZR36_08910 [Prevotella sp.]|nr:hypothetical protein [Prevotella sp.]
MIHYLFSLSGDFAACCVIVMLAALLACVLLCLGIAFADEDSERGRFVKYLKRAIIIAAVSGLFAIFVPEKDVCYEMTGIENPYPSKCCAHK